MSHDLVNQITLNFLISKQQMQKLNKKIKQKEEDKMKTDMEIYREQIVELFTKFINDEFPDDLLEDVKHSYTYFIEKSIYYLKMHTDANVEATNDSLKVDTNLEEETVASLEDLEDLEEDISDNDKEEEDISDNDKESSNEVEEDEDEEEDLEEDLDNESKETVTISNEVVEVETEVKEATNEVVYPRVYKKLHKSTNSKGVDDIQKLPLDWFNTVRQNYKQNQIIPRQKDKKEVILKSPNNYKNSEKKNISNLYEDKKNTK
jgi:hypothetical protein